MIFNECLHKDAIVAHDERDVLLQRSAPLRDSKSRFVRSANFG